MKIRVGSVVTENIVDMEKNTTERRSIITRKEVVGCVMFVAGNKKFIVQFEYKKRINTSYRLLFYVYSEEEVDQEVNETISCLQKRRRWIFDY